MGWDLFVEMVKIFGLPLTMAFAAIIAFYKGHIVTRKSYDEMVAEKDRQILREQEGRGELWAILRPMIGVANSALDKLERGTGGNIRQS